MMSSRDTPASSRPDDSPYIPAMTEGSAVGASSTSSKKKGRGPARGYKSAHIIDTRRGQKLPILMPPEVGRPLGEFRSEFLTEIGVVVRDMAPLAVRKWSEITDAQKEPIIDRLQEKFDLDMNLDHIKKGTEFQMNKVYREFRYRLHVHFISHGGDTSVSLAKQNKPSRVSQSDWDFLCDYFYSDQYKKKSETNKSNRELQPYPSLTGSKSIPAHSYDMRDSVTGEEPSRLHLWNTLHFDKKNNQWVNERAEEIHTQLVERFSSQDSTAEPISEDVLFEDVLGSRSGYKRGWGPLPKGTSRIRGSSSSSENTQLKVELHECRELIAKQEEKLTHQEEKLTHQEEKLTHQEEKLTQQEKTIQNLQATTDELTSYVRQLLPGYRPSGSHRTSPS